MDKLSKISDKDTLERSKKWKQDDSCLHWIDRSNAVKKAKDTEMKNTKHRHRIIKFKKLAQAGLWDNDYQHCLKSVQTRRFFWSVFSRIRTEYGEIRIQSKCGKIQIRKNSVFGHFSRSVCFKLLCTSLLNLPSNSSQKF